MMLPRNRLRGIDSKFVVAKKERGQGEAWIGSLELADVNWYI